MEDTNVQFTLLYVPLKLEILIYVLAILCNFEENLS